MFSSSYALLSLFEKAEKIEGRKKLQKTVYLLQRMGVPYKMNFRYHHYGPYSSELQAEVNQLAEYGLINEELVGEMYVYTITSEGEKFLDNYRKLYSDDFSLPVETLDLLMKENTPVLEMASTYAYFLEMGYKTEDAKEKALSLKPHLENYLDEAMKLYDSLLD